MKILWAPPPKGEARRLRRNGEINCNLNENCGNKKSHPDGRNFKAKDINSRNESGEPNGVTIIAAPGTRWLSAHADKKALLTTAGAIPSREKG